eukprot:TRINITY_DN4293_c0_g1_i1.p1 TRINITY_DN4293_c0_g1~~TRINITY_DN4293_c0_g1_i1.p1  ORF type:complete len:537 (-),score=110.57 TRINITY_DN4293_c0_g1_i1:953-2563(-)
MNLVPSIELSQSMKGPFCELPMNVLISRDENKENLYSQEKSSNSESSEGYCNEDSIEQIDKNSGYYDSTYGDKYNTLNESSEDGIQKDKDTFIRDWNQEYQSLLTKIFSSCPQEDELLIYFNQLANLSNDFSKFAKSYGKIIISEIMLPTHLKTIKPISLGGKAGGEKYVNSGILFKFANDVFKIYDNEDGCHKAGGNELKSMLSMQSCCGAELSFPLICVIDYLGFRLIAMSILPLQTLVYGSQDGGRTVFTSDSNFNDIMESVGKKMNLKEHLAGMGKNKKMIYFPTDIEGHIGKDGRRYVIDFSRIYPPEYPDFNLNPKSSVLYQMLRPEFVKHYQRPLSSDSCTKFGKSNHLFNNKEIYDATLYLYQQIIPAFSKEIDKLTIDHLESYRLSEKIHQSGINMRHLGRVRSHCQNGLIKRYLLLEMVMRCIKNELRKEIRNLVKSWKMHCSNSVYQKQVIDYFNKIISKSKESYQYWQFHLKKFLLQKFYSSLSDHENDEKFDLRGYTISFFFPLFFLSPFSFFPPLFSPLPSL